jgi:hypothetical protein
MTQNCHRLPQLLHMGLADPTSGHVSQSTVSVPSLLLGWQSDSKESRNCCHIIFNAKNMYTAQKLKLQGLLHLK